MTDTIRIPPHDAVAEANVIGAALLAPERLADIADWLAPDDFYRAENRLIFAAVLALARRRVPIDAVTVGDALAANSGAISPGYVSRIAAETASAANVVAYAEIVARLAKLRRAIEVGTRLTSGAFNASADPSALAAEATQSLGALGVSPATGPQSAKRALSALFADMSASYAGSSALSGAPTPWHDVNAWTGGLEAGSLYVVAARPSMGKSVFVGQIAVFTALRGQRVLWFSVEMSAKQCMARAVANVGNVPYAWVRKPAQDDPDSDTNWQRAAMATESLSGADLSIDETPALNVVQLTARARRAHLQKPLGLIVVDHLHEMAVDAQRARFDYGAITQTCKALAKECGCPVVLAAQLNRALSTRSDKRPQLTDLRESGQIEEKADVVMLLHRDDYYDAADRPGVVTIIPAKGRDLSTPHEIYLRNNFSRMRMEDWEGEVPARRSAARDAADEAIGRWRGIASRSAGRAA